MSYAAFGYRDFRLYQGARFFLTLGIQMQSVAVGWQVYELTHRAIDLGYVGLAQFLPAIGLSLVTGHVADRFDRRRVLLVCQLGVALTALLLLACAVFHVHDPRAIYAILVLFGTTRAFSGPAASALLTHLVPTEAFPNAVAWSSTVWQAAAIAGPALGGVVYGASHGPGAVFACSAVLSLTAFSLVAALHVRTGRMELRAASLSTLLAGVKYVFQEKVVLGTISLDLFAVLLGGAVALLPIFARDILDVGPWGLGILRSAPAFGAALMALLLAFRPLKHKAGPIMLMAVGVFGVATIVFGMSKSFWLSLAALVVVGASDMISVVIRSTLVQISTPPAMRGRVSAVNLVFVGASNELGEFESGITAAWLGAARAVVLGGIATCGVVAIWAQAFPALRRIDRLDEIRSPK